jgi:hypothetical protein
MLPFVILLVVINQINTFNKLFPYLHFYMQICHATEWLGLGSIYRSKNQRSPHSLRNIFPLLQDLNIYSLHTLFAFSFYPFFISFPRILSTFFLFFHVFLIFLSPFKNVPPKTTSVPIRGGGGLQYLFVVNQLISVQQMYWTGVLNLVSHHLWKKFLTFLCMRSIGFIYVNFLYLHASLKPYTCFVHS